MLINSPGRLELFWAEIAKCAVRSFALIPNFNPFNDRASRLGASRESGMEAEGLFEPDQGQIDTAGRHCLRRFVVATK